MKAAEAEAAATMLNDTTIQYEQLSEQYAKTQAGGILKPKVKRTLDRKDYKILIAGRALGSKAKRAIYNQAFNAKIKEINDSEVRDTKIEKLIKTQTKNAFENFASTLKEHRDWKIFKSLPKRVDVEAQGFDINRRNDMLTKSLESDVNMNRLLQKTTTNVSNFGKLSSGVTKQQRQINKQLEASERAQRQLRQQKISNFGKLASQTKKLTEVRKNKKMETALKKYNQIGEMMATACIGYVLP